MVFGSQIQIVKTFLVWTDVGTDSFVSIMYYVMFVVMILIDKLEHAMLNSLRISVTCGKIGWNTISLGTSCEIVTIQFPILPVVQCNIFISTHTFTQPKGLWYFRMWKMLLWTLRGVGYKHSILKRAIQIIYYEWINGNIRGKKCFCFLKISQLLVLLICNANDIHVYCRAQENIHLKIRCHH